MEGECIGVWSVDWRYSWCDVLSVRMRRDMGRRADVCQLTISHLHRMRTELDRICHPSRSNCVHTLTFLVALGLIRSFPIAVPFLLFSALGFRGGTWVGGRGITLSKRVSCLLIFSLASADRFALPSTQPIHAAIARSTPFRPHSRRTCCRRRRISILLSIFRLELHLQPPTERLKLDARFLELLDLRFARTALFEQNVRICAHFSVPCAATA